MTEERRRMHEIKKIEAVLGNIYCYIDEQFNRLKIQDGRVEQVAQFVSHDIQDFLHRESMKISNAKSYID